MSGIREKKSLGAYPINVLRNAAILHARCDWVIYIEADMLLPSSAKDRLAEQLPSYAAQSDVSGRPIAWILPLYMAPASADVAGYEQRDRDWQTNRLLPVDKRDLRNLGFKPHACEQIACNNYLPNSSLCFGA